MHTLAEVRDKQLQGSELLEALGYGPFPSPIDHPNNPLFPHLTHPMIF